MIKTFKEKHGVRPFLHPGDCVQIDGDRAIILEAETNVDGSPVRWNRTPRDCASHAWRPTYSVDWQTNTNNRHVAWYLLDEFETYEFSNRRLELSDWGAYRLMPSGSDCANVKQLVKKADDELVEAMYWAADPVYDKCFRGRGLAHSASLYEAIRAALAVVRQDRQKARAAPLAKDGPVTPSTHGGRADGYRHAMNRTDKQNHETTTGE